MTPENLPAAEPAPQGMGELSRLTGVFFEPGKTFADIAQRPRWLVPLLLVMIVSIGYMVAYGQHVGFDRMMQQQFENNPRFSQMTPEQRQQSMAIATRFASVGTYVSVIVGTPIYYLAMAGILLGIVAGLLSVPVKFKQVLAVVSYANLPHLISGLLSLVVMFIKNPDDFNLQNPLAFNVGAFLDPQSTPKFLHSVAVSLDLFSIWVVVLLAVGLKAAGGRRLSFGGALFAVALPWGIWVLVRGAMAGAGMMGAAG